MLYRWESAGQLARQVKAEEDDYGEASAHHLLLLEILRDREAASRSARMTIASLVIGVIALVLAVVSLVAN